MPTYEELGRWPPTEQEIREMLHQQTIRATDLIYASISARTRTLDSAVKVLSEKRTDAGNFIANLLAGGGLRSWIPYWVELFPTDVIESLEQDSVNQIQTKKKKGGKIYLLRVLAKNPFKQTQRNQRTFVWSLKRRLGIFPGKKNLVRLWDLEPDRVEERRQRPRGWYLQIPTRFWDFKVASLKTRKQRNLQLIRRGLLKVNSESNLVDNPWTRTPKRLPLADPSDLQDEGLSLEGILRVAHRESAKYFHSAEHCVRWSWITAWDFLRIVGSKKLNIKGEMEYLTEISEIDPTIAVEDPTDGSVVPLSELVHISSSLNDLDGSWKLRLFAFKFLEASFWENLAVRKEEVEGEGKKLLKDENFFFEFWGDVELFYSDFTETEKHEYLTRFSRILAKGKGITDRATANYEAVNLCRWIGGHLETGPIEDTEENRKGHSSKELPDKPDERKEYAGRFSRVNRNGQIKLLLRRYFLVQDGKLCVYNRAPKLTEGHVDFDETEICTLNAEELLDWMREIEHFHARYSYRRIHNERLIEAKDIEGFGQRSGGGRNARRWAWTHWLWRELKIAGQLTGPFKNWDWTARIPTEDTLADAMIRAGYFAIGRDHRHGEELLDWMRHRSVTPDDLRKETLPDSRQQKEEDLLRGGDPREVLYFKRLHYQWLDPLDELTLGEGMFSEWATHRFNEKIEALFGSVEGFISKADNEFHRIHRRYPTVFPDPTELVEELRTYFSERWVNKYNFMFGRDRPWFLWCAHVLFHLKNQPFYGDLELAFREYRGPTYDDVTKEFDKWISISKEYLDTNLSPVIAELVWLTHEWIYREPRNLWFVRADAITIRSANEAIYRNAFDHRYVIDEMVGKKAFFARLPKAERRKRIAGWLQRADRIAEEVLDEADWYGSLDFEEVYKLYIQQKAYWTLSKPARRLKAAMIKTQAALAVLRRMQLAAHVQSGPSGSAPIVAGGTEGMLLGPEAERSLAWDYSGRAYSSEEKDATGRVGRVLQFADASEEEGFRATTEEIKRGKLMPRRLSPKDRAALGILSEKERERLLEHFDLGEEEEFNAIMERLQGHYDRLDKALPHIRRIVRRRR